jgi:hypothetical protein
MKHTRGEWLVMPGTDAPRICVEVDKDWPIVMVISGHSDEGIKANENLIAAAPDLLAALDKAYLQIIELLNEGDFKREVTFDAGYIIDALTKAKGGAK